MPTAPSQTNMQPTNVNVTPVSPNFQWTQTSQPAAGSQATATKGAAAGIRHVCAGFIVSVVATTALAGGESAVVNLRDSTTGAGTILLTFSIGLPGTAAIGQTEKVTISGLAIHGTVGNAMTLEFAAGMANAVQSVTLIGYDSF